MKALYFDGQRARVIDRPPPAPAPNFARVRVTRAGVCNTDLEIARGYMGFAGVLGHELVGVVDQGPPEWLGRRVVAEINFACGACAMCARGLARHCPTRTVMGILGADGAIAEYVSVPIANLHAVADSVTDDAAAFTEPLAAAFEILEQVHVVPGTRATVLGDGKLGNLVAQVLHQAGARVLCVGKHTAKLARLARRGIATVTLDHWSREKTSLVVEATGSAKGFEAAVNATEPRGTLVLKSTVADKPEINLAPLVIDEITVVGSRCGSFAPALRALETASVDVVSLISATVPLVDAERALQLAGEKSVTKVLVACG